MNRLLQGDVGSGKTVVALYAMLRRRREQDAGGDARADRSAGRAALPHAVAICCASRTCRIELFTSRTKQQQRGNDSTSSWRTGKVHIAVGTQALIQEDVEFANLGLVVVDEQHKLGVRQRAVLKSKGHSPHYLVMTATPIPRTLALSYFADFDVSVIDELPPGRQPIQHAVAAAEAGEQGVRVHPQAGRRGPAGVHRAAADRRQRARRRQDRSRRNSSD